MVTTGRSGSKKAKSSLSRAMAQIVEADMQHVALARQRRQDPAVEALRRPTQAPPPRPVQPQGEARP